jgi:hypothetical protein
MSLLLLITLQLLEEIEKTRLVSLDAAQELIAASFGRPLPSPGQTETIRTLVGYISVIKN